MRSRIHETVKRPFVSLSVPSVCLSCRSTVGAACSRFAAEHYAGVRYQSIAGAGTQQQRPGSMVHSSKRGQCHVDSRVDEPEHRL